MMLQLLSMTLAFDDSRFFGSVMFTNPTHPNDKPSVVLVDHADQAPWFRLSNVDPDAHDPSDPAMVEADRIMRFILTWAPERLGRARSDFPQL
ncbi:hypothetical protein [Curtobacterium sp. MCBD17_032]|uniref:hypothetical protein n=1 Tax=Curtobacterium sp. MCBD17_032 TaxID=2175659 RepID=UPI000DA8483D|nr:hypothetical protein [Curtobacterium sp. MCBD17_032]PZE86856.1 hypothetical protein DEI91_00680 [Curtobacterium sp. MCBD17_032]